MICIRACTGSRPPPEEEKKKQQKKERHIAFTGHDLENGLSSDPKLNDSSAILVPFAKVYLIGAASVIFTIWAQSKLSCLCPVSLLGAQKPTIQVPNEPTTADTIIQDYATRIKETMKRLSTVLDLKFGSSWHRMAFSSDRIWCQDHEHLPRIDQDPAFLKRVKTRDYDILLFLANTRGLVSE